MSQRVLLAPSILSADFSCLGDAIRSCETGDADFVHVDVMDGHFVPNLTIGPPVVKSLRSATSLPLDVHLMVANPDQSVGWYLEAGADFVTVHVESCVHLHRVIQTIHAAGAKAGVSLNPATPITSVRDVLADVDLVLVMSVNPGFGGQRFIERSVQRIEELVELCEDEGASPIISVDGGIDTETAPRVASAGARMLIAGNAVFGTADPVAALRELRRAADRG